MKRIEFTDNADCIELIERKASGIFDILDEENKLPRPTHDHFTTEVHNKNRNHNRISKSDPIITESVSVIQLLQNQFNHQHQRV